LKLGITMLIQYKDDIQFVTEFPCFLGHPVLTAFRYHKYTIMLQIKWKQIEKKNYDFNLIPLMYTKKGFVFLT